MGMIRVDKIMEYLPEPLRACLKDTDPYVAKTAALCVPKLYDMNPELVEQQGFIDMLRDLLGDSNHTVVSNAVAALAEIDEVPCSALFQVIFFRPHAFIIRLPLSLSGRSPGPTSPRC